MFRRNELYTSILNATYYALIPGNIHDKILCNTILPPVDHVTIQSADDGERDSWKDGCLKWLFGTLKAIINVKGHNN